MPVRRHPVLVLLLAVACGNPNLAAQECDEECPIGTAIAKSAEITEAIDLDLGVDPSTYAGELAFKRVGEGSCEMECITIEPCDEGTFPVITEDCFTCGLVSAETGEVNQGSCSDL